MYVMLLSLFTNNTGVQFNVYIINRGLEHPKQQQVEAIADKYGHKVHWLDITDNSVDTFHTIGYISLATYYRIYLPELLPAEIKNILYLDADIIVKGSVEELMNTDIDDCPLVAVKEAAPYQIERLGITDGYDYFNNGVLLMNIQMWRENGYADELKNKIAAERSKYLMHDQDAMNAMFYRTVKYADPRWNHQTGFYHISPEQLKNRYGKDMNALQQEAVVIHYVGHLKPWHYLSTHPYKALFAEYLEQTPFTNFIEQPTLQLAFKKAMLKIKHKTERISRSINER